MAGDFLLREQFVTDPTQIVHEYVYGTRLPPEQAAVSNQLVYSIMSNPRLLRWIHRYIASHRGRAPHYQQVMLDLGRAVARLDGSHVVFAFIRSATEKEEIFGLDQSFLAVVFASLWSGPVHAQTDDQTDSPPPQTRDDPTTPGTHEDPTTPGTHEDPTTPGTHEDPTTPGTHEDPTTPGTHEDPTTPDPTTPGTGTRALPADYVGLFGGNYMSVSLMALAQYALELKNVGALDVAWSE
jgi:hypothetical protein